MTELPLSVLTQALVDHQPIGSTAILAVCAPQGTEIKCVAGMQDKTGRRFGQVFTQIPRTIDGSALPITYALAGKTGVILARNIRRRRMVAAYAPVGQLGLGTVLMVSPRELNSPVTDLLKILGPLLAILVLVGIVLLRGMVSPLVRKLLDSEQEMQSANARLHESEMHTRALLDSVGDGIIAIHEDGKISLFNPAAERMFGYSGSEVIGKNVRLLMPEPERSQHDSYLRHYLQTGKTTILNREREVVGTRKNGTEFPIGLKVNELRSNTGRLFIAAARDITERRLAEQERHIAATAFETGEGILITDSDGRIIRINQAFSKLTGYSAEELIGSTPAILHSGRQDAEFYQSLWEILIRDGYWQGEVWNRRKNGEVFPQSLTITAVTDDKRQVTHYVGVCSDITLRKKAEEEIHQLAFFDPLTKLPNRNLFWDRLRQTQAYNARYKFYAALLFIDLDNFKTLNDTKGHHIGDLLLIEVARRLQEGLRRSDTVARLGGDEFVAVLVDLNEDAQQAVTEAHGIGQKLLAALNQPYSLQESEHYGSASIGVSLFRGDEISKEELLKRADTAMYHAKSDGGNRLRFFDPAIQAALESRVALEADLRRALPLQQLKLYYQAQVSKDRDIVGAEVLVRWQHPERGLILPADFISLAEDTGLIVPLGHWVLQKACAQLKAWQANARTRQLGLSVNISASQFRPPDFVDQVLDALATADVDPGSLTLELTESLMLDNTTENIDKMRALRLAGVRLSLDDFGTGQSSLTRLWRLPVDEIKIDQSFVREISIDTASNDAVAAIIQAIIAMAESLGLDIIAEGVETEKQYDFLKNSGCHLFQGYLFGKPVPIDDLQRPAHANSRLKPNGMPESAP
ncbi:MAG: EAL domain-containing protein [Acidiferrobacterales bacterium]